MINKKVCYSPHNLINTTYTFLNKNKQPLKPSRVKMMKNLGSASNRNSPSSTSINAHHLAGQRMVYQTVPRAHTTALQDPRTHMDVL